MLKGNITRTFYTCFAYGFVINGVNSDGTPILEQVTSNDYITTNPNDMATAKREVKKMNKKVLVDTIQVVIDKEEVYAMDLQLFYENAHLVQRADNGRIK